MPSMWPIVEVQYAASAALTCVSQVHTSEPAVRHAGAPEDVLGAAAGGGGAAGGRPPDGRPARGAHGATGGRGHRVTRCDTC